MNRGLLIQDYRMMVRLGCEAWERELPQEVRVTLEFSFSEAPLAEVSDELKETLCYAKICEELRQAALNVSFKTVERLGAHLADQLGPHIGLPCSLKLSIHKVKPPVSNLLNGVTYRIEREYSASS